MKCAKQGTKKPDGRRRRKKDKGKIHENQNAFRAKKEIPFYLLQKRPEKKAGEKTEIRKIAL